MELLGCAVLHWMVLLFGIVFCGGVLAAVSLLAFLWWRSR